MKIISYIRPMKTYYIYHIPNYKWKNGRIGKVGCTDDLKDRIRRYPKNTVYEVLETHSDIFIASDREILLQQRYGYPVDKKPYWKAIQMITIESCSKGGKINGRMNVESGHMERMRAKGNPSLGGKIGGKIAVESGQWASIKHLGAIANRRPILQYHKDGTFIREWGSGVEVARELNLHRGNITSACQGKYKTTGGFVFKYKEGNVC